MKSMNQSQLPYKLDKVSKYITGYKNKSVLKLIESLKPDKRKVRILDFGCGRGELLKLLKEKGYQNIFGIDFDKNCMKLSSDYAKIFCSIEEFLKTENQPIDIVILSHVLEHLPEPSQTLRKIKSITNKYIVITVPNPLATLTLFRAVIRRPKTGHITHYWSWEAGELQNFLESHNNLKVLKWSGDYVSIFPYYFAIKVLPNFLLAIINRLLYVIEALIMKFVFPFFVTTLICLCEKKD